MNCKMRGARPPTDFYNKILLPRRARSASSQEFCGYLIPFVKEHSVAIFIEHDAEALPLWRQIVFDVPIEPISTFGILLHNKYTKKNITRRKVCNCWTTPLAKVETLSTRRKFWTISLDYPEATQISLQ